MWKLNKRSSQTSLVVQWLRVYLSVQKTWVQSLVWEDAAEQLSLWATTTEPTLEPTLCNERPPQ